MNSTWFTTSVCTPVPCVPGPWSNFSSCPVSCGGGVVTRNRTLDGLCSIPALDTQPCNTVPCPVSCIVSNWSDYTPCSLNCGPGTQTRSRTVLQQALNGGTSCPPLTETIDCQVAPCGSGPSLQSVILSDLVQFLIVSFSSSTNGTGLSCSHFLDNTTRALLGIVEADTACQWQNSTTIFIYYGPQATFHIGSNFSLLLNVIYDISGTFSLVGPAFTTILAPVNPPRLTATITGPTLIPNCGKIFLDGSLSGPSLGTTLTYSWTQLSFGPIDLGTNSSISIDAGSFFLNYNYTIQLKVTNRFGFTAFALHTLTVSGNVVAFLEVGSPVRTVYRSDAIAALAAAQTVDASCNVSVTTSQVLYVWKTDGDSQLLNGVTGPYLYIPGNVLEIGQTYRFHCSLTVPGYPNAKSQADLTITVIPSPLHPIIAGGDRSVLISSAVPVILNASPSFDPDTGSTPIIPDPSLNFRWFCLQEISQVLSNVSCFQTPFISSSSKISISSTQWSSSHLTTAYIVTVVVSKDGRTASTSVRLVPQHNDFIGITIKGPVDVDDFNPTLPLSLLANLSTPDFIKSNQVSLQWSLDRLDLSLIASTPTNGLALEIAPNTLLNGAYKFTLNATGGNLTTISSIIVTVNPPYGGYCTAVPPTGIAYQTLFTFTCLDWSAATTIEYSFAVQTDGPTVQQLTTWNALNKAQAILPSGNLTINALLRTTKYASILYTFPVIVTPVNISAQGGLETFSQKLFTDLVGPATRQANLNTFTQAIYALTDVLATAKKQASNDSDASNQTEQSVAIRDQLITSITTFSNASNPSPDNSAQFFRMGIFVSTSAPDTELTNSLQDKAFHIIGTNADSILSSTTQTGYEAEIANSSISLSLQFQRARIKNSNTINNATNYTALIDFTEKIFNPSMNLASRAQLIGSTGGSYTTIREGLILLVKRATCNSSSILSGPGVNLSHTPCFNPGSTFDITAALSRNIYGNNNDTVQADNKILINFRNSSGEIIEYNRSNTALPDAHVPFIVPQTKNGFISFTIPHEPVNKTMSRRCKYWSPDAKQWQYDGCIVDFGMSTVSSTVCICSHTTDFGVDFVAFEPHVNTLSASDFRALTPANVRANPTTLIALCTFLGLFFILLPFALYKDKLESNEELKKKHTEKWNEILTVDQIDLSFVTSVTHNLRSQPTWWSPFFREFGDSYTSFERLITLFTTFYVNAAIGAIFFGAKTGYQAITVGIISAAFTFIVGFALQYLFTNSGEGGLRTQIQKANAERLKKTQKAGLTTIVGLLNDDFASSNTRLPHWGKYLGYILCFVLTLGSMLLMITYGIQFDTKREALVGDVAWTVAAPGEAFSGMAIRTSLDPLDICQNHCVHLDGCNGIVVRDADRTCFEMSGHLINITNYDLAVNLTTYSLTGKPQTSSRWVLGLVYSTIIGLLLDGLKVVAFVVLIWYCCGTGHRVQDDNRRRIMTQLSNSPQVEDLNRKHKRHHSREKSLEHSPAHQAVEFSILSSAKAKQAEGIEEGLVTPTSTGTELDNQLPALVRYDSFEEVAVV